MELAFFSTKNYERATFEAAASRDGHHITFLGLGRDGNGQEAEGQKTSHRGQRRRLAARPKLQADVPPTPPLR